jgi:hypothetical protein
MKIFPQLLLFLPLVLFSQTHEELLKELEDLEEPKSEFKFLTAKDVFEDPEKIHLTVFEWDLSVNPPRKEIIKEKIEIKVSEWQNLKLRSWCYSQPLFTDLDLCMRFDKYKLEFLKDGRIESLTIYDSCERFSSTAISGSPLYIPKEVSAALKSLINESIQQGSGGGISSRSALRNPSL